MIILEYKIKAKQYQYLAIDEAIRIGQFVLKDTLRYQKQSFALLDGQQRSQQI